MERVLIVDDDPDIVRLVSYNLNHAGFEVQTATTGRAALELVQKQPPDLVVLDVMLPDVDGLEVCRTPAAASAVSTYSDPHADGAWRRNRSCRRIRIGRG